MIQEKLEFFENLLSGSRMDNKTAKTSSTKKSSIKQHQKNVKKIVSDFTRIRRPQNKGKLSQLDNDDDIQSRGRFSSNSLPRTKNRDNIDSEFRPPTSSLRRSLHFKTRQNSTVSTSSSSNAESYVESQVLEFGEKLEKRRNKKTTTNTSNQSVSNSIAINNEDNVSTSASEIQYNGHINEEDNNAEQENHQYEYQDVVEGEDETLETDYNIVNRLSNSSICEGSNFVTEPEDSEDIFGLNDFDAKCGDNYVLEAFNKVGEELVITHLEISRKSISPMTDRSQIDDLVHDSDLVVHENEIEEHVEPIYQNITGVGEKTEADGHDEHVKYEFRGDAVPHTSAMMNLRQCNGSIADENEIALGYNYYTNTYNYHNKELIIDEVYDKPENLITEQEHSQNILNSSVVREARSEKIDFVIEELIKTEQLYIDGLEKIVKKYVPYVGEHCPSNLLGKSTYLFGNIKRIYNEALKFHELLKDNCSTIEGVAKSFITSANMFALYPKYSKNKPRADIYLKEFDAVIKSRQAQLGDRLDLASYLLTPIQRLGKYVLLLESIKKELKKKETESKEIDEAISIIKSVMRRGNDSLAIDSIKYCLIDLSLQGSFLMREDFNILKPKKFESMVFLFEKIIVFTVKAAKSLEEFRYADSIAMSDLTIATFEEKSLIFNLVDYPKTKKSGVDAHTYILEARTTKIKANWTTAINKILWEQLLKTKEQQRQLHDDQGKRTSHNELPKMLAKKEKVQRSQSIFYN